MISIRLIRPAYFFAVIILLQLLLSGSGCVPNNSNNNSPRLISPQTLGEIIKQNYSDFKEFQFLATPLSNHGVGYLYQRLRPNNAVENQNVIQSLRSEDSLLFAFPDQWYSPRLTKKEKEEFRNSLVNVKTLMGYNKIVIESSGTTSFEAFAPYLDVFGFGLGVKNSGIVKVEFSVDSVNLRELSTGTLQGENIKKLIRPELIKYLYDNSGNVIVCSRDIVLNGYQAKVEVKKDSALYAKLSADVKISKPAASYLAQASSSEEAFIYKSKEPVVVATLFIGVKRLQPPEFTSMSMPKGLNKSMPGSARVKKRIEEPMIEWGDVVKVDSIILSTSESVKFQ